MHGLPRLSRLDNDFPLSVQGWSAPAVSPYCLLLLLSKGIDIRLSSEALTTEWRHFITKPGVHQNTQVEQDPSE